MQEMKRLGTSIVAATALLLSLTSMALAAPTVPSKVTVGDKTVTFDQGPVVQDDTLYLPLRAVAEAAGAQVEWTADDHAAHVTVNGHVATFYIGQMDAEVRKIGVMYIARPLVHLQHAPIIVGNRTLVPAEVIDQILGVTWSGK